MKKLTKEQAKERDEIIFGEYEPKRYCGGCRSFAVKQSVIKKLLEKGYADPEERQNESPSTQEFLDLFSDEDDNNVLFEGYVVSPDRYDCRVAIEEVTVTISHTDCAKLQLYVETLRYANEFSLDYDNSWYYLRAWWD